MVSQSVKPVRWNPSAAESYFRNYEALHLFFPSSTFHIRLKEKCDTGREQGVTQMLNVLAHFSEEGSILRRAVPVQRYEGEEASDI